MILSESTWKDISQFADPNVVALVPLGATEQHGLHLPLNTDYFNSVEFARRAEARTRNSAKILLLQGLPYGVSSTHMAFTGTISLTAETYIRVVREICKSLTVHGIKKIVLFNGHVGNSAPLSIVCTEISLETGAEVLLVNWWDLCPDSIKQNFGFMFHTCEAESSVSLVLGQSVYSEKASGQKPISSIELIKFNMFSDGAKIRQASVGSLNRLSSTGTVGSPKKMDQKKGEVIVNIALERLVQLLVEFSHSPILVDAKRPKPLD